IEAHNHIGKMPRFSRTDRQGFEEFTQYIHDSLPDRPYAATVWGGDRIYGEYFLKDGTSHKIRSITAVGEHFHQFVSKEDDAILEYPVHDRQLAWFGHSGQTQLRRTRVAVVGCGGTGSHVIQNLAYLRFEDFILIDPDMV